MTAVDEAKGRELLAKISPTPWYTLPQPSEPAVFCTPGGECNQHTLHDHFVFADPDAKRADLAFIAAAPDLLASAYAEIDRLTNALGGAVRATDRANARIDAALHAFHEGITAAEMAGGMHAALTRNEGTAEERAAALETVRAALTAQQTSQGMVAIRKDVRIPFGANAGDNEMSERDNVFEFLDKAEHEDSWTAADALHADALRSLQAQIDALVAAKAKTCNCLTMDEPSCDPINCDCECHWKHARSASAAEVTEQATTAPSEAQ